MKTEADCYGRMFPDVTRIARNEPVTGKVFGYRVDQPGIAVTNRFATVDHESWERCMKCPEFDGCYRLSVGTALMELAVKS